MNVEGFELLHSQEKKATSDHQSFRLLIINFPLEEKYWCNVRQNSLWFHVIFLYAAL